MKKYDLVLDPLGGYGGFIVKCKNGKYVKFDEIKESLEKIRDTISKMLYTTALSHHYNKKNLLKKINNIIKND